MEDIFIDGHELEIRQVQLEKMRDSESADWKQNVSCAPQTITEKLMFLLGFYNISNTDLHVFTTANMEAALLAALK